MAAAYAIESLGLSERRACLLTGISPSVYRYKSKQGDDAALRRRMRELAWERKRFGSPRLHIMLKREGLVINHKRTERIYSEEGLALKKKRRRIFQMALQGKSTLDITKTLNGEGIPTSTGKHWLKSTVHRILSNEAYTGTLVWGVDAKDGAPPVRVEDAFPAIVTKQEFRRITRSLRSKAPARVNPRRASSPYLLSGLVKCEKCGKALTAAEAKSGKYSYYVCHSLLKKGKGTCKTPRLNSKRFEKLMIDQIRANILTESNIRDLVRLMDEEMDGVAAEQRERLENIEAELIEVRRRLDRVWHVIENSELDISDATSRIREHRERQEKLEIAAEEARALLSERRAVLDNVDTIASYAQDMSDFLMTSEITESRAFIKSFVKEIKVKPGKATVYYTLPTPPDSPIGGGDAAEVALHGPVVRSSVHVGGPSGITATKLPVHYR